MDKYNTYNCKCSIWSLLSFEYIPITAVSRKLSTQEGRTVLSPLALFSVCSFGELCAVYQLLNFTGLYLT